MTKVERTYFVPRILIKDQIADVINFEKRQRQQFRRQCAI